MTSDSTNIVTGLTGLVPPQSIDAEEAVIGAILVEPNCFDEVAGMLTPEMFYKSCNQLIYKNIREVSRRYKNVDLVTLVDEMRRVGDLESVGGPIFISTLASNVVSSLMVEQHARIVKYKFQLRELIRVASEINAKCFNEDEDMPLAAEEMIYQVLNDSTSSEAVHVLKVIDEVIKGIEKVQSGEMKLIGIPSGFTKLDRSTGGFKEKELTIIGGRPSMGKTALALQIGKNAALLGYPVCIFSCEMSSLELGRRYISGESKYSNIQLLQADCHLEKVVSDTEKFIDIPLYIDDTSAISVPEIRSKTRRLISRKGIKMIIVDYIQLMTGVGQSREQEVASISRGLKSIAKDLNIPVIALSQLNRGVENTKDKRPKLSDLRESGAIEQDADIVMFVHRPEKYGEQFIYYNNSEVLSAGIMDIILAKNRNGACLDVLLKCNEWLTDITDNEEAF